MSDWKASKLFLFFPLAYFVHSRSPSVRHFAFDVVVPLVPAWMLVWELSSLGPVGSALAVGLAYLAFISLYELGYLANDTLGTKKDETPRERLGVRLGPVDIAIFVVVRLAAWGGIGLATGWATNVEWWAFYSALAAVFAYHNLVESSAYKAISFIQLSLLRFIAPVFPSVLREDIFYVLAIGLVFFTYHRFIVYLDAKGRLRVPERKAAWYYLNATATFLPFVLFVAVMARSWMPIAVFGYFAALHGLNGSRTSRRGLNADGSPAS